MRFAASSFALGFVIAVCLAGSPSAQADLIAYWNFNALQQNNNDATTYSPDLGAGSITLVGFNAAGIDADEGGTLNAIPPDPAGMSLELSRDENNGGMMILALDLSQTIDPILTFEDRRNGSGFDSIQASWSTDGTTFTDFGAAFEPATGNYQLRTIDFSSINALDGSATAFIKFTYNGANSPGGDYRIDNIQVNATSIPEPSVLAAYGAAAALLIGFGLRRRRAATKS